MKYFNIHNKEGQTLVVDELTDFLFQEGWRMGSPVELKTAEQVADFDETKRLIRDTQDCY